MTIQYLQVDHKKLAVVDINQAHDLLEYLEDLEDSLAALKRTSRKSKRYSHDSIKREFLENKILPTRLKLGITQEKLASRIKTSQAYVSKIENVNYRPSLETLKKVAKALKVTVESLV